MDATRTPSFTRTDAGYTAWNGETLLGRVERSGRAWVATTASDFTLGEQYATRAEAGLALAVVAERVARLEAIADAAEPGQPAEEPQTASAAEDRPLTGELRHEAHCKRNGGVWADPCTCTPRYWTRRELDAEAAAHTPARSASPGLPRLRRIAVGNYAVLHRGAEVGHVRRTTPAHATFTARWGAWDTDGIMRVTVAPSRSQAAARLTEWWQEHRNGR